MARPIAGVLGRTPTTTPSLSSAEIARHTSYFAAIQDVLSHERFQSYRHKNEMPVPTNRVLGGRYAWNVALCEALYPMLHLMEVVLRNRVYSAVDSVHRMKPRPGLLSWIDAGTRVLTPEHAHRVQKAKERLEEKGKRVTVGRLTAELNLGFWVYLFDSEYGYVGPGNERLWPHLLERAFPHMPDSEPRQRERIHKRLMSVLLLRNRAFHHEPLWRNAELATRYTNAVELLGWLSEPAARVVAEFDRFPDVYRKGAARHLAKAVDRVACL